MRKGAERNHVAVRAADIEVQEILGLKAELGVRLHVDLQGKAELVELVDIGRTDVVGVGREDVADADAQRLGAVTVDRQRDMRRIVLERGEHILQRIPSPPRRRSDRSRLPSFSKSRLPPSSSSCIWKPPALPMP